MAWYDDPTQLRGFADALREAGVLETSEEYAGFFKFPQRYNEVFAAWEENDFPDAEHDNWDDFVAAVTDEDDTETDGDDNDDGSG